MSCSGQSGGNVWQRKLDKISGRKLLICWTSGSNMSHKESKCPADHLISAGHLVQQTRNNFGDRCLTIFSLYLFRLHGSGSDSDDRQWATQPQPPPTRGELDGASSGSSPRSSIPGSPRTSQHYHPEQPRRSQSQDFHSG